MSLFVNVISYLFFIRYSIISLLPISYINYIIDIILSMNECTESLIRWKPNLIHKTII